MSTNAGAQQRPVFPDAASSRRSAPAPWRSPWEERLRARKPRQGGHEAAAFVAAAAPDGRTLLLASGLPAAPRLQPVALVATMPSVFVIGASQRASVDDVVRDLIRPASRTLLVASAETHAINPFVFSSLPYDPQKDFTAVAPFVINPFTVTARGDVKAATMKEAVALAYPVEEIDSGCCGMAGSFGYEKEHYDISIAIGRRRLFPAVENNPNAIVVAPGISCRQQVEHATGRRPLHPAEALVKAL